MARVFITGASGYIGGEVLYVLKRSSLAGTTIVCLNRDPKKAEQIRKIFPDVEIVKGDLDDTEVITKEAEKADVVLHLASTKHVPSAKAIVAGLISPSRQAAKPGTWIQISGATLYAGKEIAQGPLGQSSSSVHADESDVSSILSIIRDSPTRVIEQMAISQKPSELRTAVVVGPLIYGFGRGPCSVRSQQAPSIAHNTLKRSSGFCLLQGQNAWSNVHVMDIAKLIYLLTEAALAGKDVGWNENGVYNPENGSMKFSNLCKLVAEEAVRQGFIKDASLHEVDAMQADDMGPHLSILLGTNAVIKSERAQKSLGWKPEGNSLENHLPELVKSEAEALGLHT